MREVALLLVLANLGFLAWGMWIAPQAPAPVATEPAVSEKLQRLVLASEVVKTSTSAGASTEHTREGGAPPGGPPADEPGPASTLDGTASRDGAEGGAPGEDAATTSDVEPVSSAVTTHIFTQDVPADSRPSDVAAAGPAPAITNVALAVPAPMPHCVSLGPFLDLAETAEAAARLRQRGHTPSQRLADSQLWVGHWVYLAPFPTREAAFAAVEKLRAHGIEDLYVEPGGEDANAVSLGLYSDRERAEALAETIRGYGYAPEIADKYRTASVYWVDVVLPARVQLNPANYTVRSGRAVRTEERACPQGTQMPGVIAEARDEY
jgi:hypothetical protein